jgi:hypothetical protein
MTMFAYYLIIIGSSLLKNIFYFLTHGKMNHLGIVHAIIFIIIKYNNII